MNKSPTRRSVTAGLALGALAMPALRVGTARAQAKSVKMAMIAPLSGPWARQGQLLRQGAEMAIDEINQKGGIQKLGGAKFELVVADAGDNTEKAKNAAQRLLSDQPDLIGGFGSWLSSFTLAVTEVTERAQLPWLTLSYSDAITNRGFKFIFQTSPTAEWQAAQTVPTAIKLAEAATGKSPKTVGLIQDNTAAPTSFGKQLREGGGFADAGLKPVVDQIFTPPLSDATPLVEKVRSAKPDFLLLLTSAMPDLKLVLEKLDEFKLIKRLPLVGNGAPFGVPELASTIGTDLLEGLLFSVANWPLKGQEEFIESFKKRTHEPWLTQDGLCGYGHTWILKEALESAGAADKLKVAEAIRAMNLTTGPAALSFPGPIKFDDKGRRQGVPMIFAQWQNGVPISVYPTDRALAKPFWPSSA
ncbi:MAG: ABC transporter substrate-binding protein [Alphaproteobacteria bacterium]|nr:ABC transporter substrate-binding protein [Alphaproteobacteria bacterium]MBV9584973.1 ABC transporter substrate-binding protein [Alphaproteobacteria bacterium]MBV9965813.1 ABC transporter substrate-binding protein [Alphaproteobacteria bacterium]